MANIDIKVPDIGDFAEVAVIELLVKVGDTVKAEQSLITVESDKASMEIPSSHAGYHQFEHQNRRQSQRRLSDHDDGCGGWCRIRYSSHGSCGSSSSGSHSRIGSYTLKCAYSRRNYCLNSYY
jgi:hypothetical protein